MAKKKVITTTEEVDSVDDHEPAEKLDDDILRALVELEGSDEVTWSVTRVSEPNSGYCGDMSTVEISKRRIAEVYGPGRYRVQGTRPDGKYFKSAKISIAAPLKSANGADKTAELIESLKDKSGDSMTPLLLAMISSNSSIVTAALARPAEPKKEIPWGALFAGAPLALTAIKDFFQNNSDSDAMEKLLKQLTLLEKLRGEENKGSTWQDLIRDGLSAVRGMVPAPVPRPAHAVATAHVSNSHGSVPAAIPAIETPVAIEPTQENLTMDWLRKKLDELLQNAAQNKNAELRAEVLLDDLPPFIPESIIKDMLSRDDWFEQLTAFDNRVLNYFGWFNELRECILETLDPDGETKQSNPDRPQMPQGAQETRCPECGFTYGTHKEGCKGFILGAQM